MIETEVQKLVIDAVRAAGGAAHKLSHRFNVGVVDLLVKLGHYEGLLLSPKQTSPAMLLEVKLDKIKDVNQRVERDPNFTITPDVTVPQHSFLTAYAKAGMMCGVMSFVEDHRGKRGLWLKIERVPGYKVGDGLALINYAPCGGHQDRDQIIIETLKQFAAGAT